MKTELVLSLITAILSVISIFIIRFLENILYPKAERYFLNNPNTKWSKILSKIFIFEFNKEKSFKMRLNDSILILKKATNEIDNVIEDVSRISKEKHETITKLEKQLEELELKENELKTKINSLENVPIESIKYFQEIVNKDNKRSVKRDYIIFILGIIITTVIGFLLNIYNKN